MSDWMRYFLFALAWIGFAGLVGKYIRMRKATLKRQVMFGFAALLVSYFIGLLILFIGIVSAF
ncbi:MAG: hypothetical protein MUF75_00545 [Bacteroidia bacterium]|jgi:hypothetical protein|nr:hypothetical protein [Bacteroidia bacterium]